MNNELITLTNRSLVLVSGKDSEDFLQSIITIDLRSNTEELLSSCFLSPQGKLLNQFFVKKEENHLLLDLHKTSFQSFIEKMQIYKLNSDVNFEEKNDLEVVVCLEKEFQGSFIDPRNKNLGWRGIREKSNDNSNSENYEKKKAMIPYSFFYQTEYQFTCSHCHSSIKYHIEMNSYNHLT